MADFNTDIPLYVDLDGTLIKTDLLIESIFDLIKKDLRAIFLIPIWLLKGRAYLKAQLAQRVNLASELLPLNPEFFDFLLAEKEKGRRLILISASSHDAVVRIGNYFGLFDEVWGSDAKTNLKARAKLEKIVAVNDNKPFAYAGNSSADLVIWGAADEVLRVNCAENLGSDLLADKQHRLFDTPQSWLKQLWQAMRPHQWLKNGLLFIPLVLAHQINDLQLLLQAAIGFVCFSFCASSVYLLNDILDLEADRRHPNKRQRPFASGHLAVHVGAIAIPILFGMALLLALLLPDSFIQILLAYWIITLLYSLFIKRVFLLDVLTLAGLYSIRLLAGAAASSIIVSPWLLAFSLAIFSSLGLVKRVTELGATAAGKTRLPGRAYKREHLRLLTWVGYGSSALAVAVLVFYIYAPETSELYGTPLLLWLNCALLAYLLGRIWRFARSGALHDDPVLFAISDHPSQLITAIMFLILWLAI